MAGHGGGAWKVAYADFVTAMMAFFLVMWITAQDQKIKQAVARYFNNPMNMESVGTSTKPDRHGSLFSMPARGSVPEAESVAVGPGRHSYTAPGENSPATQTVGHWLHGEAQREDYWLARAAQARQQAAYEPEVREELNTAEEVATRLLALQLQHELTGAAPASASGTLYEELVNVAMADVNWRELAEDLLRLADPD